MKALVLIGVFLPSVAFGGDADAVSRYRADVRPILERYCFDCHADGEQRGNLAFDGFSSDAVLARDRDLWRKVLANLRAGVMPPKARRRPSAEEELRIRDWVKADVFDIDPRDPDPGHVTLRRLNRLEYRNTIRDLMGIDFDTEIEFPPDDTGYGFDTVGDVLSVSPLLLEKYMRAAETIVERAVPATSRVVRERLLSGSDFVRVEGDDGDDGDGGPQSADRMTFYESAEVEKAVEVEFAGDYRLALELHVDGGFDFDPGRCRVVFSVDGLELLREEYIWYDDRTFHYDLAQKWEPGTHRLSFALESLCDPEKRTEKLDFRVLSASVQGPLAERHWVRPERYDLFFPGGGPPDVEIERQTYLRWVLARFARRAFRRPVEESLLNRLVTMVENAASRPGTTFEQAFSRAAVAILSSPRFLFRIEGDAPISTGEERSYPLVDEYSLASRLSYFLWSTMPDAELFRLAARGELRENSKAQLKRMLADPRSDAFMRNFTGQWLQARDVEHVSIDPIAALGFQARWEELLSSFRGRRRRAPDEERTPEEEKELAEFRRLSGLREKMNPAIREAMRRETELVFDYVVREDRSVLELLDSDYTFLNDALAEHYGVPGVEGAEMRRVTLPEGSPRGGILTQGTFLVVTSNPTRTSPVKRGLFILDNILGTPAPPPPSAVPELEESANAIRDHEPTLREVLEVHRSNALCSSCHSRFDPLGLALENFNALGMWREDEKGRAIDPAGKLITGEEFDDVGDLKKILVGKKRADFYRTLTERLLTYSLGRGLDYYDEHTLDVIVERLEASGGRFSALLEGVIESAPFQKRRRVGDAAPTGEDEQPPEPESDRARRTIRL